QGIQIASDGVAEVSMTEARANLTQLIREVRYGGRPGAFTERGQRSAYVVPPDWYERARAALGESCHRLLLSRSGPVSAGPSCCAGVAGPALRGKSREPRAGGR